MKFSNANKSFVNDNEKDEAPVIGDPLTDIPVVPFKPTLDTHEFNTTLLLPFIPSVFVPVLKVRTGTALIVVPPVIDIPFPAV